MPSITINGITVDTDEHAAEVHSLGLQPEQPPQFDHILIHTEAPLTTEQREQVAAVGAEVQEYVSPNTYLASYTPTDISAVTALPFVDWADEYLNVFKIPPTLLDSNVDSSSVRSLLRESPHPSRTLHTVDLLLHPNVVPTDDLVARIATTARVNPDQVTVTPNKVRVTTQGSYLPPLATIDAVREIQPVLENKLYNNVARTIINADVVVAGTPYRGDGEIVAVADTGFDQGDAVNCHPAFTGRVDALVALGRAVADDPDGHGTHVAGSVLGVGNSATMGGTIEGTAPEAHLILQSLLDSSGGLGGIPANFADLFQPAYDDGARVHTNSWGPRAPWVPYNTNTREIDEFVWNNPDLVICFAAGNSGIDADSDGTVDPRQIGAYAAAKNCITVGASESLRPDFRPTYGDYWPAEYPTSPVSDDQQANDAEGLAAFSSRGPTPEGRIKPDVVAPGTSILSALSRNAPMDDFFGHSDDALYWFSSGTSMATPLVAGCAAVLRESLVKNGMPTPSAALVKSLLINGATELVGQYSPSEAGASPNTNSGWGRVDLAGSVIIPGNPADSGFGEGGPLREGEEDRIGVTIPEERDKGDQAAVLGIGTTFKITLVWSDPPGPLLQNDLDLIVIASDGTERHGNSGTSDTFDRENNVEQIVWTGMPAGDAEIIVRAARITQFPQPYAYAWRIS